MKISLNYIETTSPNTSSKWIGFVPGVLPNIEIVGNNAILDKDSMPFIIYADSS